MLKSILKNKATKLQKEFFGIKEKMMPFTFKVSDFIGLILYVFVVNLISHFISKLVDFLSSEGGNFVSMLLNIFPNMNSFLAYLITKGATLAFSFALGKFNIDARMRNIAFGSIVFEKVFMMIFKKSIKETLIAVVITATVRTYDVFSDEVEDNIVAIY